MDDRLINPYLISIREIIHQMAGITIEATGDEVPENEEITAYKGVTSIITFAGRIKGRLLLSLEASLAITIAGNTTGEEAESIRDMTVLTTISELNNIVAGDANTHLNNKFKLGLRLAPPVVLATSKETIISLPKITSRTVEYLTDQGKLKVNIAFEGGISNDGC
jgi:chemotaxis protein CheX